MRGIFRLLFSFFIKCGCYLILYNPKFKFYFEELAHNYFNLINRCKAIKAKIMIEILKRRRQEGQGKMKLVVIMFVHVESLISVTPLFIRT